MKTAGKGTCSYNIKFFFFAYSVNLLHRKNKALKKENREVTSLSLLAWSKWSRFVLELLNFINSVDVKRSLIS